MRTLILLRHGKSSWSDSTLSDRDRPLAARGGRAAKRIGKHMRKRMLHPALVLCSSSLRTRQTLEAIQPALGKGCRLEFAPELYAAPEEVLLAQLRALPESVRSVLLIGHNPGLQDLALSLVSSGAELARLQDKFPTCGLAVLALRSRRWSALNAGDGELVHFAVPRELD